ncbi:hypothetical protein [Chryseobacterium wanjuense]
MTLSAVASRESVSNEIMVRGVASTNAVQVLQGRAAGIQIGTRSKDENVSDIINSGRINMTEVKSSAKYMKLFNDLKDPEVIYQIYLKNRKEYESLPQYYFDISQLLFKK